MDEVIKVAQKLALRNNKGSKTRLSGLMVMTDAKRLPDPGSIIASLPAGSIVVIRAFLESHKLKLINKNKLLCKKNNVLLSVSGSFHLAKKYQLNGLHIPEKKRVGSTFRTSQRKRGFIISTSCHSRVSMINAQKAGVDLLTLSPVFPTKSHPERESLRMDKCQKDLRSVFKTPVYALGGISQDTINKLTRSKFSGIAGISLFLSN